MCGGDTDAWRQRPSPFLPQLIAWEPEHEEEATVVTVRPNFQDSVHVGYVAGLRKFAEYFTSVLCFTTPGDGPRSPPQLVRTHEDGTGGSSPEMGDLVPRDVEWGSHQALSKRNPLHARSWWGSRGCRGFLPWVRGCVLSLGVFGQFLAPWDISASVTSWTHP